MAELAMRRHEPGHEACTRRTVSTRRNSGVEDARRKTHSTRRAPRFATPSLLLVHWFYRLFRGHLPALQLSLRIAVHMNGNRPEDALGLLACINFCTLHRNPKLGSDFYPKNF